MELRTILLVALGALPSLGKLGRCPRQPLAKGGARMWRTDPVMAEALVCRTFRRFHGMSWTLLIAASAFCHDLPCWAQIAQHRESCKYVPSVACKTKLRLLIWNCTFGGPCKAFV